MLTYKYIAKDPATGREVKSEVHADSEMAASKLIKAEGLAPIDIKLVEDSSGLLSKFQSRIRSKDKVLFSRQLSTLINAGLPLIQSLRSVASQSTSKPLRSVINRVISDVEAGTALSVAMSRHPQAFNNVYVSMIAAGEASGTLDKSLERLAVQQEKDAEIISKVRGAMVYPIVVLLVMVGVVGFMLVSVLPQVEVLYNDMPSANLPLVTKILLAVSHFIIDFWWLVLILLGIAIFFMSRWARTFGGRRAVDRLKMRMWPAGPLFMKMYMARFARTGTTLVASGVPLLQMLEITAGAVNNVHIADSIKSAIGKVRAGKSLSEAIENDPNFLVLVPNMLKIGEQSGAMEQMLGKVADYYEKEVDDQIRTISTTIEPVLMIALGLMAFIIVAAVLLPVYSLAGQNIL